MNLKSYRLLTILLMILLFKNFSFSQTKKNSAYYYFEQANIKSQVPPGYNSDSLARQCIVLYSKAIDINPKFSKAYRNRGRLYADLKLYKNAINDLTQAIRYSKKDERWNLSAIRGQYYYFTGDYVKAIKDYDFAIQIDGNPAYLYLFRAKAYWKLAMKAKVCKDYSAAVKRNPDLIKDKEFLNCD